MSWIAKERYERIPKNDRLRFAHICPDFVIELLSHSDSLKETMKKMDKWIENGCRLGWLIDPEYRITYIYKPGMEVSQLIFSETLLGEQVLPGFQLRMDTIIEIF